MNAILATAAEFIVSALMAVAFIIIVPLVIFGGIAIMGYGLNTNSDLFAMVGGFGQVVLWVGGIWFMTRDTY